MKYYKSDKHKIEFTFLDSTSLSFESHNHISIYAVGLIVDGSVLVTKDDVAQKCTCGDLFIIPPYLLHSILPTSGKYSIITLCLGTEFLDTNNLRDGQTLLIDLADQLIQDGILTALQVDAFA
ncbi:MAG: AraC family ligand binding domain-containing protein, partial [Acetobacterium sp.]|nr:AraC family ligand binding domain-containing protein [Bacillota bacterium]MCG2730891.1 AraC family ligand binding domain-containing protein [Acetobacterium sp.]